MAVPFNTLDGDPTAHDENEEVEIVFVNWDDVESEDSKSSSELCEEKEEAFNEKYVKPESLVENNPKDFLNKDSNACSEETLSNIDERDEAAAAALIAEAEEKFSNDKFDEEEYAEKLRMKQLTNFKQEMEESLTKEEEEEAAAEALIAEAEEKFSNDQFDEEEYAEKLKMKRLAKLKQEMEESLTKEEEEEKGINEIGCNLYNLNLKESVQEEEEEKGINEIGCNLYNLNLEESVQEEKEEEEKGNNEIGCNLYDLELEESVQEEEEKK